MMPEQEPPGSARVSPKQSLALLRGAAVLLPRPVLSRIVARVVDGLGRAHPRLLGNLARLDPAVVHIDAVDLPYRLAIQVGRAPVTLTIVDRQCAGADAVVTASVATLLDLLEGRIDSDTLFFRRDLAISGNSSVIVGLRNALDREELCVADEIAALCGRFGPPARALARRCDRSLERIGERVAAMHRTLHPPAEAAPAASADLDRCRQEISALTARLAKLEARQKRRDEKAA